MKRYLLCLLLCFQFLNVFAQDRELDSLSLQLQKHRSEGIEKIKTLILIANRLVISNPDSSLGIIKQVERSEDLTSRLRMKINNVKGQAFAVKGQYKQAEYTFLLNQSFKPYEEHSEEFLSTYVNLAELYRITYQLDTGLYYLSVAKKLINEKLQSSGQHVRIQSLLLVYKCMKGDYAGGVIEGMKAIELCKKYKHRYSLIYLNVNMGKAYLEMGQMSKAIAFFREAVDYAIQFNNVQNLTNAYMLIGTVYHKQKDYQNSLLYMKRALQHALKIGEPGALSEVYGNIASNFIKLGQVDSARQYFLQSELQADRSGLPDAKASVATSIAEMAYLQLNFKLAASQHQKALSIYQDIGDSLGVIQSLLGISKAQWALNKSPLAFTNALEARQMAMRLQNWELLSEALACLINYYKITGDQRALISSYEDYLKAKDSLNRANDWKETNQLLIDFNLKEQIRALEVEQKEKEYQLNQQLSNQQFTLYLLLAAVLLLIMAFAWYFNTQRLKKMAFEELQAQKELLAEQKEELNAANEVKDRLFSVIAHDLRSPLGSLYSLIQLMSSSSVSEEEFRSFLPKLQEGVEKAIHITEQLLSWSSIQFNGDQPSISVVNLYSTILEEINLAEQTLNAKFLVVQNQIEPHYTIKTDPDRLRIIVRNLLGNAIKFSRSGGVIELYKTHSEGKLFLSFKDYGLGMSQETLKRVSSGISTTSLGTKREQGVGLGLLIVRDMLKSLKGQLEVLSKTNEGTTFTIILPE